MEMFNNPLVAINRDDTRTLMADWTATIAGRRVTVPMGFVTDGASIPRFLWRLCGHPFEAPRIYAAIRHDWHYSGGDPSVDRKTADGIYRSDLLALGVKKWQVRVEYLALRLCGRSHWKTNTKGKIMNKVMLAAFVAVIAVVMTGCVSEEMVWGGMKAVRQPDGTVLVDQTTGKPYYEKDQNHLDRFSHLTDIDLKELHVKADGYSYEAHLGSLGSFSGSNTVNVINAGLSGATKLVAECGVLYAKIAGGATADVATSVVSKMIAYFKSAGGDAEKATATINKTTNAVQITDGSTCVECTADGICKECQVPPAQ